MGYDFHSFLELGIHVPNMLNHQTGNVELFPLEVKMFYPSSHVVPHGEHYFAFALNLLHLLLLHRRSQKIIRNSIFIKWIDTGTFKSINGISCCGSPHPCFSQNFSYLVSLQVSAGIVKHRCFGFLIPIDLTRTEKRFVQWLQCLSTMTW